MGYEFLKLDIDKLVVNKENPRFLSVESEYKAIENIILNQQDKLLNLIEDILDNGLNPSELIIVVKENNKYVVLEGNRRVTAIKLINDLDFYADIDSKFANILSVVFSKKYAKTIKDINAIVFTERLEANRWIKIRHTGENSGVGILGWSKERKENFVRETGKMDKVYKLLSYVRESKYYSDDLKIRLSDVKLSHLSRLLDDPHVRETIGLTLKNKKLYRVVSEEELSKGITKILYDTLNGVFKACSISTKERRLAYIETFTEDELPNYNKDDVNRALELDERAISDIGYANEQLTLNNLKEINKSIVITLDETNDALYKVKSKDIVLNEITKNKDMRKYLIPNDFNIKVQDKAIIGLYKELKTLDIKRYPNSVEILFRILLERVTEKYIVENNINYKENSDLVDYIKIVTENLIEKEVLYLDDRLSIEALSVSCKGIFSKNNFNRYIENNQFPIDIVSLKECWNTLEPMLKILIK